MYLSDIHTIEGAADLSQHIEARLYNIRPETLTDAQAKRLAAAREFLFKAHLDLSVIHEEVTGTTWENGNDSSHALSLL
jgi:hypothetical protein